MFAYFEDVFNVIFRINGFSNFFDAKPCARLFGEKIQHLSLCFNHLTSRLLPSLDSRLVVGVDIDQ